MLVFAREVFVCKCPTDVPLHDPHASEMAQRLTFSQGTVSDLDRLDPQHHGEEDKANMQERLARGEYWMLGEVDGELVTYTWLHHRDRAAYPSLPGCEILLRADTGYGYDAWTPPHLRGHGLRRVAFLQELNILRQWGMNWEASFFVKHQLEGATRSLGGAGIPVTPLWRIYLTQGRKLAAERLEGDDAASPSFLSTAA